MVQFSLKAPAKFGLCSNCSQKLDECSLTRARKRFTAARMLGLLLRFSVVERKHNLHLGAKIDAGNNVSSFVKLENVGKTRARFECFWKHS